jgi:Icc-related predicted phosphoesterase
MLVPLVKQTDGTYSVRFMGANYVFRAGGELDSLEKRIRDAGYYPYRTDNEEVRLLSADPTRLDKIFDQLMRESIKKWLMVANERLKGTGIKCFISAGNDDNYSIDPILKESDYVVYPEGKIVSIDERHEMISCGYSNITPWRCPRDIPEEELLKKIDDMALKVKTMDNCIFNLHCPPYGTTIDLAPKLDEEMRPIITPGGSPLTIPVGSKAVRQAIERYQPQLGLHGHIHESKGTFKIGRTLCINPGSEYTEGILKGFIVDLTEKGIADYMFTAG